MAAAFRKFRVGNRNKKNSLRAPRLGLEILEERCTPANVFTWTGAAGDGLWSDGGNWSDPTSLPNAPTNATSGITLSFPTVTGPALTMTDDIPGLNVDQLSFTGSGYALSGGTVGGIVLDITGAAPTAVLDTVGSNKILATSTFSIALAGSTNVEVDAGVDTIAAPISGTGFGITKTGVGTLVVSGASTFSGTTTVGAGILQLGATDTAGATPLGATGVVVSSGASLDLHGISLTTALPLTIGGTGLSSAGAVFNSTATAATYPGQLTLAATASIVANGSIILPNTGTVAGTGFNLTLDGTGTGSSIAGVIGIGTGSVTKQGVGTWILSGANTYTGSTTITAGILKLGSAGVGTATPLGETGTTETGGGLDLGGFSLTAPLPITLNGTGLTSTGAMLNSGAIATYSGVITLGGSSSIVAGTATTGSIVLSSTTAITGSGFNLTLSGLGNASTLVSPINTGAGKLIKLLAGTWVLSSGASTFTGGASLSAGVLGVAASSTPSAVGTTTITKGPLGTGTVTMAGGTLASNGAVVPVVANPLLFAASTTSALTDTSAGSISDLSLNGVISGTGAITLNSTASDSLVLSGDPSGYSCTLTFTNNVSGMNFRLNGNASNWSAATFVFAGNVTTTNGRGMIWAGTANTVVQIGSLSGIGEIGMGAGNPFTLQEGALNTNATYSGIITNTTASGAISVNKVATVLTYSTGTISQSGTTITGSGTTFTSAMTGGIIHYSDGSIGVATFVSATSLTSSVSKTVTAGSTYSINTGSVAYSTGTISQTTTALTGTGTAFTSAMTGGIIVYSDGTTGTVTFVSATSLTSTLSKTVAAGSTYTIVYGAKWTLSGDSTFTGNVTVSQGILSVGVAFNSSNGPMERPPMPRPRKSRSSAAQCSTSMAPSSARPQVSTTAPRSAAPESTRSEPSSTAAGAAATKTPVFPTSPWPQTRRSAAAGISTWKHRAGPAEPARRSRWRASR